MKIPHTFLLFKEKKKTNEPKTKKIEQIKAEIIGKLISLLKGKESRIFIYILWECNKLELGKFY